MHVALFPILCAYVWIEIVVACVWNEGIPCGAPVCLVPDPFNYPSATIGELTVSSDEITLIESCPRAVSGKLCQSNSILVVRFVRICFPKRVCCDCIIFRPYFFWAAKHTNIHPYVLESSNICTLHNFMTCWPPIVMESVSVWHKVPHCWSRISWIVVVIYSEANTWSAALVVILHVVWITWVCYAAALVFILPSLWAVGICVYGVTTVWVTGRTVGRSRGNYVRFAFDIWVCVFEILIYNSLRLLASRRRCAVTVASTVDVNRLPRDCYCRINITSKCCGLDCIDWLLS